MDLPQINTEAERLRIWNGPGAGQYGILVGLLSLGIGASYYGSENIFIKASYILACLTLGISFLDNWEECIVDRMLRKVVLRQFSFYQRFLKFKNLRDLNIDFKDVVSVLVKSNAAVKDMPSHYTVTLMLRSGVSISILETWKTQSRSCCDLLAEKTRKYLGLSHMEHLPDQTLNYQNFRHFLDGDSSSESSEQESSDVEDLVSNGRLKETANLVSEVK